MIVFVTQELNGRKFGGVALAGFDFLQVLKLKFGKVLVITVDKYKKQTNDFDKYHLINEDIIILKPELNKNLSTFRDYFIYFFKKLRSISKKKSVNLNKFAGIDNNPNIIFVNSWSSIFESGRIKGIENFKKVVYIHGNPESFVWQSQNNDGESAIFDAAKYLDLFTNHIYVSSIGLKKWESYLSGTNFSKFYLPNKGDDNLITCVYNNGKEYYKKKYFDNSLFNIVVCGSVQKRKAQDLLLKLFPKILDFIPNIHIHIVGGISFRWGGKEIFDEIKKSIYNSYFTFHNHKDNALEYMMASDLALFTSRAEAFPITILEYMALGKPIIASNVSGVPEMIKDGWNGLLYDNNDLNSLVENLVTLFKDNNLQERISLNAIAFYNDNFSEKEFTKNTLKILNEI